ncbi:MAG: hypothetical protein R3F60_30135 [bacterium]
MPLDPAGETCTRGELTADGSLLLRPGMTAQGYFDEQGLWFAATDLKALWPDEGRGAPARLDAGGEPAPGARDPHASWTTASRSVYALDPAEVDPALQQALEAGEIFECPFNYRAGGAPSSAFLVHNGSGTYALIGRPFEPEWCTLELAPVEDFAEDDGLDDDLDFEMF